MFVREGEKRGGEKERSKVETREGKERERSGERGRREVSEECKKGMKRLRM